MEIKKYLVEEQNFIDLGKSGIMERDYGKYRPNLCFIIGDSLITVLFQKEGQSYKDLSRIEAKNTEISKHNIEISGSIYYIKYGTYRKNAKGTDIFQVLPENQAKHKLICVSWGGSFSSDRGIKRPAEYIYWRSASSNGGGTGCDYLIIDKDYYQEIDVEEI